MKLKLLLIFLLIATWTATVTAQSWNFKTVSDDDVEAMDADAANWSHETGSNNRYHLLTAIEQSTLKANGQELEYAKGLLFTVAKASSETNGNLRIDVKNKRLWVAGAVKILLPQVKAGTKITLIAKSSAGSSSSDKERGVNVSENVKPVSGKFNGVSADQVTNVGLVETDGDVVFSFSGAMYLYEISLEESDNDETDDDTPDPTPQPAKQDHSTSANSMKNQVKLTTSDNSVKYYNTDTVTDIDFNVQGVTVRQPAGTDVYEGNVSDIRFIKAQAGQSANVENVEGKVSILEAKGWFESAYVKFAPFTSAKSYNVYVKGGQFSGYTLIDRQLVRNYGAYVRADVLGLTEADNYIIKVVPVSELGTEMTANANEATRITVIRYDRSGFGHKGISEGIGAYNNDGSLKSGAHVVYITKDNAKTVKLAIAKDGNGTTAEYVGFQQIIYGYQKGNQNGSFEKKPLCIRIIGTITDADCDEFLSSAEGIQIKGANGYQKMNITIEGVGDDATTKGFGFLIRNAAYVELRNFANMLCMDDAISLDTKNEHIWVHNLDLFYGKTGSDADQVKGDGTIDIKGDSRYVTISYNHLWDNGKASLCGMKSETAPNWITYHHNWFDHTDSRHPRIRTMSIHAYNNYYDGNSKYGVGAAYQSNAFVEANYFRNCKYPMLISQQGSDVATNPKGTFSGEDGGMIKSFANKIIGATRYVTYQQNKTEFDAYEASTRDEKVPASVQARKGGRSYDNFDTDANLFYTYTPDAADNVPAVVTGWFGAGRMAHGDFQWQFDNATEDRNADIINELKNALQNYKSQLVEIIGEETTTPQEPVTPDNPDHPDNPEIPENPQPPVEGSVVCTFNKSGEPSSSLFTVVGNGSNSKGSATIDGVTYDTCLKMESSTSVSFTLTQKMKMTLYFASTETASIKIDGQKIDGSGNSYTTLIEAGSHELTKDKSVNLFGIKLEPVTN